MTDKQREECEKAFLKNYPDHEQLEKEGLNMGLRRSCIQHGFESALNSESVKGLVEALSLINEAGCQSDSFTAEKALEKFNGGSDE